MIWPEKEENPGTCHTCTMLETLTLNKISQTQKENTI